uniref:Uncharacterized protein n=1 Tax=Chromera velia CCMP2878 TaxID=1169474 RepID=A0A0G4HIW1_9ALVE|eukprot:Cvel_27981.t1-p1 / transcript=Cvel_27981.t1 / gene=Cvel_27981 / organism=Chromera_velia_CCMP2878 / gene_product=hypothetical protein / transcript_product=hypothetical protein / location=Cvel_scaffold3580:11484-13206(-) / protein_length=98 / sequence_SO=supercontig / SO=protein_coding / is_pseudo=false
MGRNDRPVEWYAYFFSVVLKLHPHTVTMAELGEDADVKCFIGKKYEDVKDQVNAKLSEKGCDVIRVEEPGMMYMCDFRTERGRIILDEGGIITKICQG